MTDTTTQSEAIVLPHYCPICGAVMEQQTETVDGVSFQVWVCPDCGFEEPVQ